VKRKVFILVPVTHLETEEKAWAIFDRADLELIAVAATEPDAREIVRWLGASTAPGGSRSEQT
jgi:hypothetical protein